jgi:uncharacterized protein
VEAGIPTVDQARTWYRSQDPVHGFDHVLRVLGTAEWLAGQVGADGEIVRAAALLHDASGAAPGSQSGRTHHEQASAAFAREILQAEGWPLERIEAVEHCIRAHRYRSAEAPRTIEARVLFDADKLDVLGAFGVARTIAYALQAGQPIYAEPSQAFRANGTAEAGEPHSAYHEYLFKLRHVGERLHTDPARALARQRHDLLVRFFDALAEEAKGPRP